MSIIDEKRAEVNKLWHCADFFRKHRDVFACEANRRILLEAAEAPTTEAFEKAYAKVKSQLASKPLEIKVEEIVTPEAPKYPVPPAGLQKYGTFRNLADARKLIPGSVFRDLMYDKNSKGLPSEKSLAFKAWLTELQTYEGGHNVRQ